MSWRSPSVAIAGLLVSCASLAALGEKPARAAADAGVASRVTDVTARDYSAPALPVGRVTLVDAFGGRHPISVEIAASREARTRGMMWRTSLAETAGMLFIFPEEEEVTFWMKNTLIPLDMVFIDGRQTIVGIVERAAPQTRLSRGPGVPAKYVLELAGGWSERNGLRPGLKVKIEGIIGIVATD
jgi:uncharacterized membrane protein (UPF0127 family)